MNANDELFTSYCDDKMNICRPKENQSKSCGGIGLSECACPTSEIVFKVNFYLAASKRFVVFCLAVYRLLIV